MKRITNLPNLPWITLSNGLRVANYSSPHPFTFIDDSVLPACSDERAKLTMLEAVERIVPQTIRGIKTEMVKIDWKLTWFLKTEVDAFVHLKDMTPWDIVLVPLPFMIACKEYIEHEHRGAATPFRVIRVADRITKEIHINKFCV